MSKNGTVDIKVNGKEVAQYEHNDQIFIEAREGTEYSITVKNNTHLRKLAVVTVDGINVLNGKVQGNEAGNGYIINAWNSIDINGFRKDTNTVGAFKFCKKESSYCNEKGLSGNNGVIGVRLYDEAIIWTYSSNAYFNQKTPDYICTSSFSSNTSDQTRGEHYKSSGPIKRQKLTTSSDDSFKLGTTWGKKINDSVKVVDFNVGTTFEEFIIYYDTRKNLEEMGITFKKEKQVSLPQAFGGFATPPDGWKLFLK